MRQLLFFLIFVLILFWVVHYFTVAARTSTPVTVTSPYVYSFNVDGQLDEAGTSTESTSPYWWVNSGGNLLIANGVGGTLQGVASTTNRWRQLYAKSNSTDTDNGLHPQNIFRLVTRSQWEDVRAQASFYIASDNFSESWNRNESNGLLLMSRYQNEGQTLYYAGVRVDGTAVIKKKINGTYYTMAQTKLFAGVYTGWQDDKNLLPHHAWISLRSETETNEDGSVSVTLFVRWPDDSPWKQVLVTKDAGQYGGSPPIITPGYAGIRTDFMDVWFTSFRLENLKDTAAQQS